MQFAGILLLLTVPSPIEMELRQFPTEREAAAAITRLWSEWHRLAEIESFELWAYRKRRLQVQRHAIWNSESVPCAVHAWEALRRAKAHHNGLQHLMNEIGEENYRIGRMPWPEWMER